MPLAHHARNVTRSLQGIGQRHLVHGKTVVALGPGLGEEFEPETLLVATGQKPCPGRRANWTRDVAVGEQYALVRDALDVRRGDRVAPVEFAVAIAEVVSKNDNDVRRCRVGPVCPGGACKHQRQYEKRSHGFDSR